MDDVLAPSKFEAILSSYSMDVVGIPPSNKFPPLGEIKSSNNRQLQLVGIWKWALSKILGKDTRVFNKSSSRKSQKTWLSALDTIAELKVRKQLTQEALRDLSGVFISKGSSVETKAKVFREVIQPVFLRNCQSWTLAERQEAAIDRYQSKLIHIYVLNKSRLVVTLKNKDDATACTKTNIKPWSKLIRTRRLIWFGQIVRLLDDSPVKVAYENGKSRNSGEVEGSAENVHVIGKQQQSIPAWHQMMSIHLKCHDLTISEAEKLAVDRGRWNATCKANK